MAQEMQHYSSVHNGAMLRLVNSNNVILVLFICVKVCMQSLYRMFTSMQKATHDICVSVHAVFQWSALCEC